MPRQIDRGEVGLTQQPKPHAGNNCVRAAAKRWRAWRFISQPTMPPIIT